MTIALAGMTIERKASSRSTKLSVSTTTMAIGSQRVEEGEVVDDAAGGAAHVDVVGGAGERPPARGRCAGRLTTAWAASPLGSPASAVGEHGEVAGLVDCDLARAEALVRRRAPPAALATGGCTAAHRPAPSIDDLDRVDLAERRSRGRARSSPAWRRGRRGTPAPVLPRLPVFMTRIGRGAGDQHDDGGDEPDQRVAHDAVREAAPRRRRSCAAARGRRGRGRGRGTRRALMRSPSRLSTAGSSDRAP